jgi:sporulation protein YlmC with PRC-barrel domain
MKMIKYLSLCTSISALVLATSAYAAERVTKTETRISDKKMDKTLGHLERANKVIGKTVYTSDNQKAGKLENLVVDLESGRILFAVVGTGILGVGGHDYAVAPGAFSDAQGETLRMNIDKAKFTSAPEFSSNVDQPEQLAQASFVHQVYQHFGQTAWWKGDTASSDSGTFRNVHKAKDVIGMKVKNVNNEDVGKVDNLMVNLSAGRIAYAILDPDASFNVGNNLFALPPDALTWNKDQKVLTSDVTREKMTSAPQFSKEQWQMLSDPSYGAKVYRHYGKDAYFESSKALEPTGRETGTSPKSQDK